MMEVSGNDIISACMSLGIMVTMNQRLDAEILTLVADEFGFAVEFVTAEIEESIQEIEDDPNDLNQDHQLSQSWDMSITVKHPCLILLEKKT